MKLGLKTFVALVISAIVPIVAFFLLGFFLGVSASFSNEFWGNYQGRLDDMLMSTMWWLFFCIILVGPISFGHVFLIGLPALLVGWHFRAIRWWSTIVIAIMIGAIPSTIYVFFFQNIGWHEQAYFYQTLNIISLGITAGAAMIMGFFGLCGGLVFWLLWRFWVSPDSPEGRPFSRLEDVEIKPMTNDE